MPLSWIAKSNRKGFKTDAERVAFMFELYQNYTSLLPVDEKKRGAKRRRPPRPR